MVTLSHVRTLRGAEAGPDIQEPMIAAVRNLKDCGAWGLISYGNKGHFMDIRVLLTVNAYANYAWNLESSKCLGKKH